MIRKKENSSGAPITISGLTSAVNVREAIVGASITGNEKTGTNNPAAKTEMEKIPEPSIQLFGSIEILRD
ncbi:hypothetical protein [Natronomonas salsuginis]|uniref:Uncharacterized protein n=1 Tax=Natronomonas salsuginis TaxID=2217661 RepID=A0A4U5J6B7_9EURY|nr:hypothetical protein [Natronomonas salsuginis]TKR24542.1 hypothetical protein DM868_14005 [Natronomonas salsuginis]